MLIDWPSDFDRWLDTVEDQDGLLEQTVTALLAELEALPYQPTEESATFKRVREARRYELWRVAHPYHPDVAVRLIIWFPNPDQVVVALVGFDKAQLGDIWYSSAAVRAESLVDQWLRDHPEES